MVKLVFLSVYTTQARNAQRRSVLHAFSVLVGLSRLRVIFIRTSIGGFTRTLNLNQVTLPLRKADKEEG